VKYISWQVLIFSENQVLQHGTPGALLQLHFNFIFWHKSPFEYNLYSDSHVGAHLSINNIENYNFIYLS
jgi:hypothetical protein